MIAALRAEIAKQWRRPRTYVVLGGCAFLPVLVTVLLELNPPDDPRASGTFLYFSTLSGLMVPVAALRLTSRFLLVVALAAFAGDAIASEANWGNLRALLTRPIARGRLLAAKALSAALLGAAATATIVLVALVAGVLVFGAHPIETFVLRLSEGELLAKLALSSLYVLWALAGVVAASFMVSTMTDSPMAATLAGVGLYVVSQILDAIDTLGSFREWLPTHYVDAWAQLFRGVDAGPDLVSGALLSFAYVVVFGGIAWWWFRRKDVLS